MRRLGRTVVQGGGAVEGVAVGVVVGGVEGVAVGVVFGVGVAADA